MHSMSDPIESCGWPQSENLSRRSITAVRVAPRSRIVLADH
jgi:hypothetical protein